MTTQTLQFTSADRTTDGNDSPPAPLLDIEALQSDDKMAAVMITGILSLAFVTLLTLMIIVSAWTFMTVDS